LMGSGKMLSEDMFQNKAQLFSYLNQAYSPGTTLPAIHLFLLRISIPLVDLVGMGEECGFSIDLEQRDKDFWQVTMADQRGFFLVYDGRVVLLTDEKGQDARRLLTSMTRKLRPAAVFSHVTSEDLLDILEELNRQFEKVLFHEGTMRSMRRTNRYWKKETTEYSRKKMVEDQERERAKWTGIGFSCTESEILQFHGRLYSHGQVTFYEGSFTMFLQAILPEYFQRISRLEDELTSRERETHRGQVVLKPVLLRSLGEITQRDVDALFDTLKEDYGAGVLFTGNPTYLVQATDMDDGSSFDIYVSDNEVTIVPLQRSSSSALTELLVNVTDTLPFLTMVKEEK